MKLTACIIGLGRIGFTLGFDRKREQSASHTMALLKSKDVEIVAGCDIDESKREAWKKFVGHKVKTYSMYKEALETPYDIVVISVNESSHLEVTLEALSHNPRLIILEKPVALNMEEGCLIKEALNKSKTSILINHERRFSRDYRFIKDYIPKIGSIYSIRAHLDSGMKVLSKEALDDGSYSLLHDGTHLLDVVSFLLEENVGEAPLENMSLTSVVKDSKDLRCIRYVNAHFTSRLCPDVNISISGMSRFFGFEIDIMGSLGRLRIGNGIFEVYSVKESKLYSGFKSLYRNKIKAPYPTGYFDNIVSNAVAFLKGEEPLYSTLETGLNTLNIIESIVKAINLQ